MGNVRNPVGPLPSSIYWRRRAVVLCLFAAVVALVVWVVLPHGGTSDTAKDGGASPSPGHRHTPLPSITPGPTPSGTRITTAPGGRGTGGGSGSADGGSASAGSAAGTGSGGTGGDGGSGGLLLSSGTSVPDCRAGQVTLTIRSVRQSYRAGQQPRFALAAVNSGATACKVNFSPVSAVVTVTDAGGHHEWATDDCPTDRSAYLLEVPAEATTTYDVTWDRAVSAPACAAPTGSTTAGPGTYHAQVAVPGLGTAKAAFTLADG